LWLAQSPFLRYKSFKYQQGAYFFRSPGELQQSGPSFNALGRLWPIVEHDWAG
jgi:hypothetical protein